MGELRMARVGFGAEAVPYLDAWEEQRRVHAAVVAGEAPDTVLLLEHPPVYTAGRRTQEADRPLDGTPVVDVDRGGKITWHGPGQLVGYPIVRLPEPVDVVAHVRRMEEALIRACAEFGLATTRIEGRSGVWVLGDDAPAPEGAGGGLGGLDLRLDARISPAAPITTRFGRQIDPETGELLDPRLRGPEYAPSNTGQRSRDRKLAAIGVRVSRGVTMHGFALNCDPDLTWYDRIIPCGLRDAGVTSLTAELGRNIGVAEALDVVERHLAAVFEEMPEGMPSRSSAAVA
ncbi:lipoyl(octanoyl) transferase LipB [Allostreptomyces psammosilenae]|uniref:Octanoyltransferase n=1 Tax=Allostreptomyces psammosilenae TaxID=1892865 RepID=A0A852ZXA6_9ACTN|nr:lipoyl(octanoyl) transferase LipB [Allostreptomyces psammosilenae]NYI06986.1 lipoyl(octanoyl) transferase [Allostreptomyces psammosilenae]